MSEFQIKLCKHHGDNNAYHINMHCGTRFYSWYYSREVWLQFDLDRLQTQFIQSVKNLLDLDNNVNLMIDSETELSRTLTLLIGAGYDIHEGNEFILTIAALKGYLSVAQQAVDLGSSININSNPLLACCIAGHTEILKLFYQEFGLESYKSTNHEILWTCLIYAITKEHIDIVKILLDTGIDINYNNELFIAACAGESVEIVSLLIERNIDLESFGRMGFLEAVRFSNHDIVNLLISYKINFSNMHPLYYYDILVKINTFRLLVTSNIINPEDFPNILHEAVKLEQNKHVIYLLDLIDKIDGQYLIIAVESNNYEIVRELIKYDADPFIENGICFRIPYRKPYSLAFIYGEVNEDDLCGMYELFLELGLQNCQVDSLNQLLEFATDLSNKTLINLAIKYGADQTNTV
jgi:ankyrin repeat protein